MEDMFEPKWGNVFTVFDYIRLLFGGLGSGLQSFFGGLLVWN